MTELSSAPSSGSDAFCTAQKTDCQSALRLIGRVGALSSAGIGVVALTANVTCLLLLLLRHRADDINMSSAWICSRNDIIASVAVVASAIAVATLDSRWPDVLVGAAIAVLFLASAIGVLGGGRRALRAALR